MTSNNRTFVATSEAGNEYTVIEVDAEKRGLTGSKRTIEHTCPEVGPLLQIGAHTFQAVSHPELILTKKLAA